MDINRNKCYLYVFLCKFYELDIVEKVFASLTFVPKAITKIFEHVLTTNYQEVTIGTIH